MTTHRRERGQSSVEFALTLPLVVAVVLVIAQLVVIGYAQLVVEHEAGEIARQLAIAPHAPPRLDVAGTDQVDVRVDVDSAGRRFIEVGVTRVVEPVWAGVLPGRFEVRANARVAVHD